MTDKASGPSAEIIADPSSHETEDTAVRVRQKQRLANKTLVTSLMKEQHTLKRKSTRSNILPTSLQGRALTIVHHRYFSGGAATMVTTNALYMGLEAAVQHCKEETQADGWYAVQVLFAIGFLIELALRVTAERMRFFQDHWNVFDMFLVVTSVADTFVLRHMAGGAGTIDLLMVLRSLRLARLARILRLLRFFKELWFLVEGIISAARTLVWAWLLTGVMLYIGAVFSTSWIGKGQPEGSELRNYFSDIPTSMYSLLQVMSVEGWVVIARVSFEKLPWTAVFFILFLSATSFSILHVVVAIIVQNTLTHASNRAEEEASNREAREREAAVKIVQIFDLADGDGNGEVTREEFTQALQNPNVVGYLHNVNVDVLQAENLFDILDYDESGSLSAAEFVEGVMTARGEAESKDLLAVQCDLWKSEQRIQSGLSRFQEEVRGQLGEQLQGPLQQLRDDIQKVLNACG